MAIKQYASASPQKEEPQIVEENVKHHSLCLDFKTRDGRVYGFAYAHLLNYLLEKNSDADTDGDGKEIPPDKLSIWFSTHDVILLGWRLDSIRLLLRDGGIASVKAEDPRYLNLDPKRTFVSEIVVTTATQAKE